MTATVDTRSPVELKNLVDGRWQDGRGEQHTSTNPSRPAFVIGVGALAGNAEVEDLDVGVLHVNSETAGADPHLPFGGAKHSGYGPKEQGRASREFFTHTTTVYLRGGARS